MRCAHGLLLLPAPPSPISPGPETSKTINAAAARASMHAQKRRESVYLSSALLWPLASRVLGVLACDRAAASGVGVPGVAPRS